MPAHRAECVMLNKGPYIVQAVQALDDILRRMHGHQAKKTPMLRELGLGVELPEDALRKWDEVVTNARTMAPGLLFHLPGWRVQGCCCSWGWGCRCSQGPPADRSRRRPLLHRLTLPRSSTPCGAPSIARYLVLRSQTDRLERAPLGVSPSGDRGSGPDRLHRGHPRDARAASRFACGHSRPHRQVDTDLRAPVVRELGPIRVAAVHCPGRLDAGPE